MVAKAGQPSHGLRHSVKCKAEMKSWLDKQLGPPDVREPPMLEVENPTTRRRLVGKQKPITEQMEPMDIDTAQEADVGEDPVAVQMENTSSVKVKRPLVDEDKMVDFFEILNAEMSVPECDEEEQTLLETGDWCPSSMARTSDLKEVQGLFDKGVFQIMGRVRPEEDSFL